MSNQITPNPSVPSQVIQEVKFPKFVNNLGIIPTSYKDSMSYYETLAWLCKYLEETVIPTVNENGEAVEELQGLYIELNSYVDHYFDTLDVQEEINNKLDEMASNGTLSTILAPLTQIKIVSTTDEMVDEYRLYVLSSNNHIYQYNEATSQFTDTGAVYSSVGNYLNVNSTIIFTTNYESLLPDLNNATDNNVYHFMLPNSDSYPAHMPEKPEGKPTTLIVTKSSILSTQLYITSNNI